MCQISVVRTVCTSSARTCVCVRNEDENIRSLLPLTSPHIRLFLRCPEVFVLFLVYLGGNVYQLVSVTINRN